MLAEAQSDRLVGVVLGGAYQLVGCIGQGGMGAVYEAHHLRLQKRVAVKLINRAMASNEETLARFHREASVASRLGHPNLVNVVDFGKSDEGEPYLVMEYLEGEDLDRRIRRSGTVPLQGAVQIARQVASALSVVHAKGIVHRDLKPANVFLVQVPGEPDFVKVLDFGVSKMKAARTKLTADCTMVGTPAYMSPEQASGANDEVDHRADQWALACIVWEMLSGRAPFHADDINALFYRLINLEPESLSECAPDLPSAVEPVLLRALSKRPADRYPSIREFARAFETAALGSWTELTPMPMPRDKLAASGLAVAAIGVLQLCPTPVSELGELGELALDPPGLAVDLPAVKPRRSRARLALVGVAVVLACSVAGVLFASVRSGRTAEASVGEVAVTNVPVVTPLPVALSAGPPIGSSIASDQRQNTDGLAPQLAVRLGRSKAARHKSISDPFEDTPQARNATTTKARAPGRAPGGGRQVAMPHPERHIFEDL